MLPNYAVQLVAVRVNRANARFSFPPSPPPPPHKLEEFSPENRMWSKKLSPRTRKPPQLTKFHAQESLSRVSSVKFQKLSRPSAGFSLQLLFTVQGISTNAVLSLPPSISLSLFPSFSLSLFLSFSLSLFPSFSLSLFLSFSLSLSLYLSISLSLFQTHKYPNLSHQ